MSSIRHDNDVPKQLRLANSIENVASDTFFVRFIVIVIVIVEPRFFIDEELKTSRLTSILISDGHQENIFTVYLGFISNSQQYPNYFDNIDVCFQHVQNRHIKKALHIFWARRMGEKSQK